MQDSRAINKTGKLQSIPWYDGTYTNDKIITTKHLKPARVASWKPEGLVVNWDHSVPDNKINNNTKCAWHASRSTN